jgi:hypothetical protein
LRAGSSKVIVAYQKWFDLSLFVLQFAILDSIFPIARLLLDIEIQASWTSDGLKTLN